jgi:hypothetical protein
MTRLLYWTLSVLAWMCAAGLIYIGLIFLVLGPMMGPRGDIDYVVFSEAQKHAANVEAFWTSMAGLVPLAIAGFIVRVRRRAVLWLVEAVAIIRRGQRGRRSSRSGAPNRGA